MKYDRPTLHDACTTFHFHDDAFLHQREHIRRGGGGGGGGRTSAAEEEYVNPREKENYCNRSFSMATNVPLGLARLLQRTKK